MADVRLPRITTTKQGSSIGGTPLELLTATIVRVNLRTLKCKTVGKLNFRCRETKTASSFKIV